LVGRIGVEIMTETLVMAIIIAFIAQFILFRFTPFYKLNLLSKLYDNAYWINNKPKVLIMGSSTAKEHIIPQEIHLLNSQYQESEVVNISESSASPYEMYVTYKKNQHKFNHLDVAYITINPHMMSEKFYTYFKYEVILLGLKQINYLKKYHVNFLEKYHKNFKWPYFLPFKLFLNSLNYDGARDPKKVGYKPGLHADFKPTQKNTLRKYICEPLDLFPVSKFSLKYYKKLKDEMAKNGTKLIFLLTPTYQWVQRYQDEMTEFDDSLIENFNRIIGDSVVIGSFYDNEFGLTQLDHFDDMHYAHSGSVKISRALFKNINNHLKLEAKPFINTYAYHHQEKNEIVNNEYFKQQIDHLFETIHYLFKHYRKVALYGLSHKKLIQMIFAIGNKSQMILGDLHLKTFESIPVLRVEEIEVTNDTVLLITALGLEEMIRRDFQRSNVQFPAKNIKHLALDEPLENMGSHIQVISHSVSQYGNNYLFAQINGLYDVLNYLSEKHEHVVLFGQSNLMRLIVKIHHFKKVTLVNTVSGSLLDKEIVAIEKLQTINFDVILITDLGHEKKCYSTLTENLSIDKSKIIYLTL
jgi:hypothetical protein